MPKSAYEKNKDKRSPLGKWIDDNTFVEQGWFVDGKLAFSCKDENDCRAKGKEDALKQQAIEQFDQKMKDLSDF